MKTLKEALVKKNQRLKKSWPNPYNITKENCIGHIEGWPVEVVTLAIKCAKESGRTDNTLVVLQDVGVSGAFTWIDTPEGHLFWSDIAKTKDFSEFYRMYTPATLRKRLEK